MELRGLCSKGIKSMTSVSEVIERYSSVGWEELATLISKGFLVLDSTF